MEKLENILKLLDSIEIDTNCYRPGLNDGWYGLTVKKGLPSGITMLTKSIDKHEIEYRVYLRNNVNFKRLEKICEEKGYWSGLCKAFLAIGYNEDIFAEEKFISFTQECRKKALDIIDAYLKSK
jgi:hypothetical protein